MITVDIETLCRIALNKIDSYGFQQKEVAEGIGISPAYLSKILNRQMSLEITARTLNEILDYLGSDSLVETREYGVSGRYERVKGLRELEKQAYLLSHIDRHHIIGEIIEAITKTDNEKLLKIKEMILNDT